MAPRLLGIDIGTGSTKGVLVTAQGEVLATAARMHKMDLPRPGWAEMDPERDLWQDTVAVMRELTAAAGEDEIAGLCVSGLGPCLILTDAAGAPVRPAILYGIDMRAGAEITELDARYGTAAILDRGGKALSSQAVGPKLLWVQRHDPDAWTRATHWHSAHSFVVHRLTGEYILDHHTASQCDPLYDLRANEWFEPWAAELTEGLAMPALRWPGEIAGRVSADAAAATGLAPGTPVCAGTVDAWAESVCAGVRKPGELMLMYGSTMFFVQAVAGPAAHPGLWGTTGVWPGSWTLAAGMATSGSITGWAQTLTGGVPFGTLVAEAAATPPGADGLLVLPYFAGERTPIFDPDARGVIAGLTLRHGRGHLFRAVYEAIAYGIRQILEVFAAAGGPASRLVAVGGGTQGGLWTQIVSDVTGRAQDVPATPIGASYGGALLAAIGVGLVPSDTNWSPVSETVKPDLRRRALYDELYDAYRALYPATRDVVHMLAAVQS